MRILQKFSQITMSHAFSSWWLQLNPKNHKNNELLTDQNQD